jgi:hypothetical protein
LVLELGHSNAAGGEAGSWHCRRARGGPMDCTQYVADSTFYFRVAARYGLPRSPTDSWTRSDVGYSREDPELPDNRIAGDRFLAGLPQGHVASALDSAWDEDQPIRSRTYLAAEQLILSEAWFDYTSTRGDRCYAPNLRSNGPTLWTVDWDHEAGLRILSEGIAGAGVSAWLPDVPRDAGTFGLVTSILQLHSSVVLQYVLPTPCSSGSDRPDSHGDPAWQILFLPEVR